jgi:nicotinamide mononucleotide transporter
VVFLVATAALAGIHQSNLLGAYGPSGWPELIAVVLYALSVWCAVHKSIWTWWTGIAATSIYLYIFWDLALYADAGLQVVFIAFSISGLYAWRHRGHNSGETEVRRASVGHVAAVLVAIILGTVAIRAWLIEVGGSAPLWDAVLTSASLGALYLLIRMRIESWYFWIAIDVGYIALFVTRDLYLSAGLYVVLLAMSIKAAFDWQALLRNTPDVENIAEDMR